VAQVVGQSSIGDSRTAVIVSGGSALRSEVLAHLPPDPFVIAADSGLDHAIAIGLTPNLVVGDLDSVSADGLAWARARGIPFEVHPADKDMTDTQLALTTALHRGLLDIVLLSGGGDRLDHTMGALIALGHASLAAARSIRALWGPALLHVLHGPASVELRLPPDTTFSALALHGVCRGVGETGSKWPLHEAVIEPGSSLGVSNVSLADRPLVISVRSGVLSVVVPHFLFTPPGDT
jgi:thiamine pyrophosphokinase